MGQFLMKPKIDFAFKEIMADGPVRAGFLSAVLGMRPEEIRETQVLNASLRREHEDDKQGILDVRVLLNDSQEIDIEIQLSHLSVWADRSLFYLSKMYTERLKPGESYRLLKKCVSVSILDFKIFQEWEGFYSCFHIREDSRNFIYTDKMEFHVMELPKLPKELKEGGGPLELWAKFINAERKEEFDMLAKKDPYIEKAYECLQAISRDKEKRMEYEAREKALRDYNEGMLEAEERGIAIGEERGIAIGEERGIAIGEERGIAIGEKRGQERINELNRRLISEGRADEVLKAAADKERQRKLLRFYGI